MHNIAPILFVMVGIQPFFIFLKELFLKRKITLFTGSFYTLSIGGKKKSEAPQQQQPFVPPPTAGEQFNAFLAPYMQEIVKAFQPFLTGALPALTSNLSDVIKNNLAQSSQPGFTGISKELSDQMFQRAQERIAPSFAQARNTAGIRAAGTGVLRSPVTTKQLTRIDLAETEARRQSAVDQAIQEYTAAQNLKQQDIANAGNFLNIGRAFEPGFTTGGNFSAINPPAPPPQQANPLASILGMFAGSGGFGSPSGSSGGSASSGSSMSTGDWIKLGAQIAAIIAGGCWVAREALGMEDGRWLDSKHYILSDKWLSKWYGRLFTKNYMKYGERFSKIVKRFKLLRFAIKPLFEYFAKEGLKLSRVQYGC